MSTEGLAALVCSYKNRVVAVEGAIYKAPEDGPFTRIGRDRSMFATRPPETHAP